MTKVVKKADAPKKTALVHAQVEAGVSVAYYAGLSKYLNRNRLTMIAVDGDHSHARTVAQLTDRTLGCVRAMKEAYGKKEFVARGFDNAVLAMLISSGLVRHVKGGTKVNKGGVVYLTDKGSPVVLTAA